MFSRIARFFRPAAAPVASRTPRRRQVRFEPQAWEREGSAPMPYLGLSLAAAPVRVQSLGAGLSLPGLHHRTQALPAAHVTAILGTAYRGSDALRHAGQLSVSTWAQAHLVQATYAPGTSRTQVPAWAPAGVRGVQLGAAQYVRGRQGHLHVYAMVYTG